MNKLCFATHVEIFRLRLEIFHTLACFHTLVWEKSYTSMENFPLHVWVNNFQYSMEHFRRFFLECSNPFLLIDLVSQYY